MHPPFPGGGPGGELGLPATQPIPRPTPGATPGVPWPRFSWIYTYAESQAGVPRGIKQEQPGSADQIRQRRPMPCCSSPLPSPVQKGRSSPGRRSATPLLASDRLCIDDALARSSSRRRMPARQASSFLPAFLSFVFTYFPLYAASRAGKQDLTIFNAMPFA